VSYANIPVEKKLFERLWREKREMEMRLNRRLTWTQFLLMKCGAPPEGGEEAGLPAVRAPEGGHSRAHRQNPPNV
jgi:hypothetical protein